MKGFGIFFIVMATLNLLAVVACLFGGYPKQTGTHFSGVLLLGAIGAFLLHRAKQKQKDNL